jgi:recombination protein RecA
MAKQKKSELDSIWDQMEKLYGDDGLCDIEEVEALSSGSPGLDDILGIWGNPRGRLIQYAGKRSSGKTLMSLMAIKEWQQKDPKNWAYFIDAECSFDKRWAQMLGVDTSPRRLRVLKSNNGAEIFEKLCGVPHKEPGKAKTKPGLLDIVKEMGGSDKSGLGIIVLDSVAAVAPPLEVTSRSGKSNMALMARFLPPELRKIIPLLSETGVMFIAINQVRTNPGQLYGNPEGTPGGAAWGHHCSVMVHFTMRESKDAQIIGSEKDVPIGHVVMARVDKNKVAPPKRKCEFRIQYTQGVVDKHIEIGSLGIKYGIVSRPNNRTYVYDGNKYVGKDSFFAAIAEEKLESEMLAQVKEAKDSGMVVLDPTKVVKEEQWADVPARFIEEE